MGFVFLPCPCVSPAFGAFAVPGNFGAPAVPCSDVHSMKILCVCCHLCQVHKCTAQPPPKPGQPTPNHAAMPSEPPPLHVMAKHQVVRYSSDLKVILLHCVFPAFGAIAVVGNFGAPAVPRSDVHSMKILCVCYHLCQVMKAAPPPKQSSPLPASAKEAGAMPQLAMPMLLMAGHQVVRY